MKKTISLFLALVLLMSVFSLVFADEIGEQYYTVKVEYSDNVGKKEQLNLMVQGYNVYVDAKMLAERFGYTFGENGNCAVIFNKDMSNGLPVSISEFEYNSTRVSHMLFNRMVDTYKAPFASVKNDKGSWIPLEYSLLLLNSGMAISERALLIDMPTKRVVDYFYDIAKNAERYNFDWTKDFGYKNSDITILAGSSHLVNLFNGLLGYDGTSWASLFQQFLVSTSAYDKKYGEDIALLICTESQEELEAAAEKMEFMSSLLNEDGELGELLSNISYMDDFEVGQMYRQCETALEGFKAGNTTLATYNRSYEALEKALDKQTWFSHTGGYILEVQKGASNAIGEVLDVCDVAVKIAEIVGYVNEFQNQDEFSLTALKRYLDTQDNSTELPNAMKKSMMDYSDALSSNIMGYTVKRFWDNIDQWIADGVTDKVPLFSIIGKQGTGVLLAWNIASNTIPFISDGISAADKFELALYAQVLQGDTFRSYLNKRNSVFSEDASLTAGNVYDAAQLCYIYLKSCMVTRDAAIASLENKKSELGEEIQPLIDVQNEINGEIANILAAFKEANSTNIDGSLGFLPSDNENYLNIYDDSKLVLWITEVKDDTKIEYEMKTETIETLLSDGRAYYSNTVNYPFFLGSSDVESELNQRYADMISEFQSHVGDSAEADEAYKERLNDPNLDCIDEYGQKTVPIPFYDDVDSEVIYNERNVLSIKETYSMWSGGMHAYHSEKALNFDISTGKELTYLDILDGTNAEIDAVLRLYLEKFVYSPTEVQIENLKQYTAYTLCDDGLCFYYNVGDAVSRQEIVIPYTSEDTYIITVTDLLN